MASPRPKQLGPVKKPAQATRSIEEPPGAKTLIEHVYSQVKSDIVNLRLRPGAKLPIDELRARYSVSSSTIREALLLLVAERLVTAEGQRGFRTAPASFEDFQEITRLRKMMESMALRESIADGDDNWESSVVAAFHKLNLVDLRQMRKSEALAQEWDERNHAFHEALVGACRSHWVRHFRRILYQSSSRYRRMSLQVVNVRPGVQLEHKAIMDATLSRNADLACKLSDAHIERTFVNLVNAAPDLLARK
jgi:GntR family transcriptional regulator, carbon starvation induced regulator